MYSQFTVRLEDCPDPAAVRAIQAGLEQYNLQFAPPDPFEPLTILARDGDNTLRGGLLFCVTINGLHGRRHLAGITTVFPKGDADSVNQLW